MEITTCSHREQISNFASGIDEGICAVCHQVRRYEWREGKGDKPRRIARIIKLGRLDGKIVLPGPKDIVDLPSDEAAELKAATPAHNKNPEADADSLPPVPPRHKNKAEAHRYWEEHKAEVLADLARLGHGATMKRWRISPGVLTTLRGTRGKGRRAKAPTIAEGKPGTPPDSDGKESTNRLPAFPEFNDSWPFIVQEKWLSSYVELRRLELVGK